MAAQFAVQVDLNFQQVFSVLENDPGCARSVMELARPVVGPERVVEISTPDMGSEDFADMLKTVPVLTLPLATVVRYRSTTRLLISMMICCQSVRLFSVQSCGAGAAAITKIRRFRIPILPWHCFKPVHCHGRPSFRHSMATGMQLQIQALTPERTSSMFDARNVPLVLNVSALSWLQPLISRRIRNPSKTSPW